MSHDAQRPPHWSKLNFVPAAHEENSASLPVTAESYAAAEPRSSAGPFVSTDPYADHVDPKNDAQFPAFLKPLDVQSRYHEDWHVTRPMGDYDILSPRQNESDCCDENESEQGVGDSKIPSNNGTSMNRHLCPHHYTNHSQASNLTPRWVRVEQDTSALVLPVSHAQQSGSYPYGSMDYNASASFQVSDYNLSRWASQSRADEPFPLAASPSYRSPYGRKQNLENVQTKRH